MVDRNGCLARFYEALRLIRKGVNQRQFIARKDNALDSDIHGIATENSTEDRFAVVLDLLE